MDNRQLFERHRKRLEKEAWLKSVLLSLVIGFAAMLATAVLTWVFEKNGLWFSLSALVVVTGGLTPLFYFKRFRPDDRQIARRIDGLGLEERVITMTELADSKEYIAVRQRADAQEKMKALDIKQISLHVSAALIALVCVFGTLGLSLTTVSTLSYYGLLPTIGQIIDTTLPPEPIVEFEVNYYVEDGQGGIIEGEEFQIVAQGETGSLVYAAADEGWAFAGWSDGYAEPYRQEEDVQGNMEIFALFEQMGGTGDGDGEPTDQPPDQPGEQQGDNGDGDDSNPVEQGGGKYEPANQIIDEATYYRDVFGQYYDLIVEYLSSGEELPEDLRIIIEAYFNILK
ncbi:MAG: hypothetical protein KH314_04870 [Subdoligranulum sp.]|jgi:S-layer domain protein|nr:hypothetical protein [Subdoligranulum sp.]